MTPELQAAADAAIAKAVKAYQIAVNGLTEQQVCEAFKQAIACGDFERLVVAGSGAQAVHYLPFREFERKDAELHEAQNRIETMREALNAALSCFIELRAYDIDFYRRLPCSVEMLESALGKETKP